MRPVYAIGTGRLPVSRRTDASLRLMGATVVRRALEDASAERPQALFLGNMLSDELQGQKHLGALVADEAGLAGIEAVDVRAATATGAAAIRAAYLAIASGDIDLAVAVGVEKMSDGNATEALARALDAREEVPTGATLLSTNARLLELYMQKTGAPYEAFARFAVNAHHNACTNPFALFRREVTLETVTGSREVAAPLRLFDCAPICDGAACVVLSAERPQGRGMRILASASATDRFRVDDRPRPLRLEAAISSARQAYEKAQLKPDDVAFCEVHDAFSIMACLLLEAAGFAEEGQGWRAALEGEIEPGGRIPIATAGGLKARGHPIGATAIYQAAEIFDQLNGRAGPNQLERNDVAMLQSVGGAGTTVLTHIFGGT